MKTITKDESLKLLGLFILASDIHKTAEQFYEALGTYNADRRTARRP